MSDIQKSNDRQELRLFFPRLLQYIEQLYARNPFAFKYKNVTDGIAIMMLVRDSLNYWNRRFYDGEFSNFVVCFSEKPDVLSQWRGYADDGKGCSLGFSFSQLEDYCVIHSQVLRLEKIEYLPLRKIDELIWDYASGLVSSMQSLRQTIVEKQNLADSDPDTDIMVRYQFDRLLEWTFIESLRFKEEGFSEETEWRLFLRNPGYKNPDWLYRDNQSDSVGPSWFSETIEFLKNRIEFMTTDDNLIPYYPINFSDFTGQPIIEAWMGPKNRILIRDFELFLKQNGYSNVNCFHSRISYC